jgi:uncharacterized membrane protein
VNRNKFDSLLDTEAHRQRLSDLVIQSIEEKNLISEKILESEEKHLSPGSRLADKVAAFGGSWRFIVFFLTLMFLWMGINLYLLTRPFDPYPFILLNLILSTIAALQAPLIMMSQNRKEEKDRERAINDYMINLKAEIEIRDLNQKIELLIADQMKTLFEIQKVQMDMMEQLSNEIKNNSK